MASLFRSRFPPRLLTDMTLRRFGISACTANPEDLPPSLAQHGSYWRLSTSSSRSFQDTHSAESFFWISTTCLDLSSSLPSRSTSRFKRTISRSRGSAFCRPAGLARAASAPWSRWRRHVTINEEYRPSRRSIAPRAERGNVSYSARTLALYFAENCRRPKERSGTSGSGGAVSSIAPAWWRVRSEWLIVVVMGEVPSPPFSSLICQGKPSHSRLTQRGDRRQEGCRTLHQVLPRRHVSHLRVNTTSQPGRTQTYPASQTRSGSRPRVVGLWKPDVSQCGWRDPVPLPRRSRQEPRVYAVPGCRSPTDRKSTRLN